MIRKSIAAVLLLAALGAQADTDTPQATAEAVVTAIARGEYMKAADRLHYPPNYSPEKRREDAKGVSESLALIVDDFGTPTSLRSTQESPSVFEVAAGGGDMPYWSSLGALSTYDVVYRTTFEKLGRGYLIVRFVESTTMTAPVVHRVSFCLPVSSTSADQVVRTMKRLLQFKKVPLPPDIDSRLRESLRPIETAS